MLYHRCKSIHRFLEWDEYWNRAFENKPGILCRYSVLVIMHRENVSIFYCAILIFFFELWFSVFYGDELTQCFFFCVGHIAQTQVHTENRTLPASIVNINEHYRLVSFLLLYSQLFCFLLSYSQLFCFLRSYSRLFFRSIFSVFFKIFNSNKKNLSVQALRD